MKTFFNLSLTTIAILLFSGAFVETKAQGILNDILKRMDNNYKSLQSLRANVAMDKYNSQIDEHDIYDGKAIYYFEPKKKGRYVRIDWTKPVQETLSVVNKKYVIYTPRRKQAITGNASDAKGSGKAGNLFSFINMSKAELKSNFDIKYFGEEKIGSDIPTWHLEMTPKNSASYNFKKAEMWVDGNGMPLQIKITENNNDTITLLLTNIQKNVAIKANVFKVDLPKGTNIIKG